MNGSYYQGNAFPGVGLNNNTVPNQQSVPSYETNKNNTMFDEEQSYIENILRLNKGKRAKAYFSFPDSNTWRDKIFEGIIEEAGKDHLVMSDPKTGKWQLILLIYLNFVEFDEKIVYNHSYSEITY